METFDYIIVGAGAAGCALANQLTQNPVNKVLLIEAGKRAHGPWVRVPKAFVYAMRNPKYSKMYPTDCMEPDGSCETWIRGRGLGGSTNINGMLWTHGQPQYYSSLSVASSNSVGWNDFAAGFRAIEDHELGSGPSRGAGGPLSVSVVKPNPLCDRVVEAAAASTLKLDFVDDFNGSAIPRIGYIPSTTKRGLRVSAAHAFIRPIRQRKNLSIRLSSAGLRLVVDGLRVTGVVIQSPGQVTQVRAKRDTILCLGSLETPALLERSGIGRGDVLRRAGVPIVLEVDRVGEGLSEQRGVGIRCKIRSGLGYNQKLNTLRGQAWQSAKFFATRGGPLSYGPYELIGYYKSSEDLDAPDAQLTVAALSTRLGNITNNSKVAVSRDAGLMMSTYIIQPQSRGSVHITSADPADSPVISPNFFSADEDRVRVGRLIPRVRQLLETQPLSDVVLEEEYPGLKIDSAAQFLHEAITAGRTGYHTIGTCAMGARSEDPVDAEFRLRGIDGLRIADASVFPEMPSGATMAPVVALGWIAGSRIGAEQ